MDRVISKTKYDRNDHKKYYRFHMIYRSKTLYFFIAIMIFFLVMTITNTLKNSLDIEKLIFSWMLTAFTLMLVPLMIIFQINNIVKRESRERLDSIDIITVTKAKIEKNSSHMEGKVVIGWKQVEAIYETKEFIYIYTGPQQGIFIKKEDIVEGDIELFRKIAQSNMTPNRRGKVKYKIRYREDKDEK